MRHRKLKLMISKLCDIARRLDDCVRRVCGMGRASTFTVFTYHSVPDCRRGAFAEQMEMITEYATPVGLDYTGPFEGGHHYVAVTFDDGYGDILENAVPELVARSIPATVFALAGYLGKRCDWVEAGHECHDAAIMNEDQLKALANIDGIAIGSHMVSHRHMTELTEEETRTEMRESRQILESLLGRPVTRLAFPFGTYVPERLQWARDAGYEHVYGVIPELGVPTEQTFLTGRVGVLHDASPAEFRLQIRGAYGWLGLACGMKRRVRRMLTSKSSSAEFPTTEIEEGVDAR